ncbi:MAG: ChbG/HpnK family deacetylase, partial [Candidatus Hermodarchaeota archaeon]
TVMTPKYLPTYLKLAEEFKVAPFMPRPTREQLIGVGLGDQIEVYEKMFESLEMRGVPLLDHMIIDTLKPRKDKVKFYCKLIEKLEPGVTHFLFHPAKMSPELMVITPDSAKLRNQDYEAFTNPRLKECLERNNIIIIGYREIQKIIKK